MDKNNLPIQFDSDFFEKTRISILSILLREKESSFNHLLDVLDTSEGRLYSHINKLIESGYISSDKNIVKGKIQTTYIMTSEGKKIFKKYINFLENFLDMHTD